MIYICPTWEYVAHIHLLRLQCLQERVSHATGNLNRCTLVCELHMDFKIPYMYDYKTKLCRTQAEITLNHANANVCGIEQGEAMHGKYKRHKLGSSQAYYHTAD
jgi:hypothetical protein